ncbi:MAG: DUF4367 domain-containing protein [Ruminococcus sp.]|uniref:DUF4367 domain-containing protein n=1 Tax=Schaedlerella arabinosiphila TaxID=2044587 RepID=A0A3R8KY42_9FIRM|nr:DUF4367 domain-containing protein [Schaedlerella arabinosiphila]MCI8722479.1 DUF4367 domain-containing protein [Ruminococcus sp.]RRK34332.1 DUF4367 domain-containing protein [Schaedlerella arabinosiphila]
MQKQNESSITLSLHQEIEREVREIEKEMERHPELDELKVTEEMDRALLEEIQAYEAEMEERRLFAEKADEDVRSLEERSEGSGNPGNADRHSGENVSGRSGEFRKAEDSVEFSAELMPDLAKLSRISRGTVGDDGKGRKYTGFGEEGVREEKEGKVCYRRKKRKYWVVSLVAVLVIVLGVGVNSVGSKPYWKTLWDRLLGTDPVKIMNVEDMEIQETEDGDELTAYKEIKEKLNIQPVRMFYKPNGMKLSDYKIYEEMLMVRLVYKYQDEIIRYILYVNDADSSWGEKEEDLKVEEYQIFVNEIEISVEEYQVPNNLINRQVANFEYQGVHYQLTGVMEKSEFKKILENFYFF